jgi:hypothetical protein
MFVPRRSVSPKVAGAARNKAFTFQMSAPIEYAPNGHQSAPSKDNRAVLRPSVML